MKALITGASSGIGKALAYLLAKKGYALILSGRNASDLQAVAGPLHARFIQADLAKPSERQKLIEVIWEELPELVINCAGYTLYGEMLSQPVTEQMSILEVNGVAPIELTLESAHALIRSQKSGVILNVSSSAAEHPAPGMGLYGPAKACLTHFCRTLNTELSPRGVHILVTCPGMVATEFATKAAKKRVSLHGGPVMTAQYVAEQIWKQIEKKQEKRIINWFYRLAAYLIPSSIVKKVLWKKIKQRL